MAISGLHMSFIGMGFYGLLRRVGCPVKPAGVLGILFLLGYTVMIGGGVSAIRAFVMFGIRVGADLCGRAYDMATSLAVAAALIALESPMYLRDAGYLLSFGAVLEWRCVSVNDETGKNRVKDPAKLSGESCGQSGSFSGHAFFIMNFPVFPSLNLVDHSSDVCRSGRRLLGSFCVFFQTGRRRCISFMQGILNLYEWSCNLSMKMPFSRIVTGKPEVS
ncbi:MAG: ComEC/Rec2 family competence protein [Mediterraneibacter gnavus]